MGLRISETTGGWINYGLQVPGTYTLSLTYENDRRTVGASLAKWVKEKQNVTVAADTPLWTGTVTTAPVEFTMAKPTPKPASDEAQAISLDYTGISYMGMNTTTKVSIRGDRATVATTSRLKTVLPGRPPVTVTLNAEQKRLLGEAEALIIANKLWNQKDLVMKASDGGSTRYKFTVSGKQGNFLMVNVHPYPKNLLGFTLKVGKLVESLKASALRIADQKRKEATKPNNKNITAPQVLEIAERELRRRGHKTLDKTQLGSGAGIGIYKSKSAWRVVYPFGSPLATPTLILLIDEKGKILKSEIKPGA